MSSLQRACGLSAQSGRLQAVAKEIDLLLVYLTAYREENLIHSFQGIMILSKKPLLSSGLLPKKNKSNVCFILPL